MRRPWLILPPGRLHYLLRRAWKSFCWCRLHVLLYQVSNGAVHVSIWTQSLPLSVQLFLVSLHLVSIKKRRRKKGKIDSEQLAKRPSKKPSLIEFYLKCCTVCLFCKWPEHFNSIWHWIASNGAWGIPAPLNSHPQPDSSSHLETVHRKISLTAAQAFGWSSAVKMVGSGRVVLPPPVRPVLCFFVFEKTHILWHYLELHTNSKKHKSSYKSLCDNNHKRIETV